MVGFGAMRHAWNRAIRQAPQPTLQLLFDKVKKQKRAVARRSLRVPGAAQHGAKRSGALQTRDPGSLPYQSNRGPGSAVHRAVTGGKG